MSLYFSCYQKNIQDLSSLIATPPETDLALTESNNLTKEVQEARKSRRLLSRSLFLSLPPLCQGIKKIETRMREEMFASKERTEGPLSRSPSLWEQGLSLNRTTSLGKEVLFIQHTRARKKGQNLLSKALLSCSVERHWLASLTSVYKLTKHGKNICVMYFQGWHILPEKRAKRRPVLLYVYIFGYFFLSILYD